MNARKFFQTLAEIQFESGYPYIVYEDTANRANPIHGKNHHVEPVLRDSAGRNPSHYNEDGSYSHVGRDISCNLGSLNIAKAMDSPDFERPSKPRSGHLRRFRPNQRGISSSIARGNRESHAIGLGQMNLHGYLAREEVHYGSEEALDFVNIYFYSVLYYALKASHKIAVERGETFYNFEKSKYASGEFFDKYINEVWEPTTEKGKALFEKSTVEIPTQKDWEKLRDDIMRDGMYNQNLQAIPPTGSISYINGSTSSIHPIVSKIEIRKEGKIGRVYYPAPYMTNDNLEYYEDAYELGTNPSLTRMRSLHSTLTRVFPHSVLLGYRYYKGC